tara:strand:- start:74 stop:1045 length:972 start_codon:yes stop_codon:yes gene_type:complete
MQKNILIFLILLFNFFPILSNAGEIEGLFGYKIGDKISDDILFKGDIKNKYIFDDITYEYISNFNNIDELKSLKISKKNKQTNLLDRTTQNNFDPEILYNPENFYEVSPVINNENFNRYYIAISPLSKRITRIMALGKFEDLSSCNEKAKVILEYIQETYSENYESSKINSYQSSNIGKGKINEYTLSFIKNYNYLEGFRSDNYSLIFDLLSFNQYLERFSNGKYIGMDGPLDLMIKDYYEILEDPEIFNNFNAKNTFIFATCYDSTEVIMGDTDYFRIIIEIDNFISQIENIFLNALIDNRINEINEINKNMLKSKIDKSGL